MRYEYLFPIISTTLWGISITGAKIVGAFGYDPIEITFGRFAIASIIFIPILLYLYHDKRNVIPEDKRTWMNLFGLALTGVAVNNSIFYFGLALTDASIASLLVSLNPLMTTIFAVIMLGEVFTKRKGISIILGIFGVALIIGFSGSTGKLFGNLLIVIGITIWGSSFSFSRKVTDTGLSSIAVTGISEIMGTILLLPYILFNNSISKFYHPNTEVIFWFIFMGVLSSVIAYIIHYKAIAVLGAGTVAPSTNIIPFSGAITAWLLLNEQLQGSPFIGVSFVILGVILVQTEKSPQSTK